MDQFLHQQAELLLEIEAEMRRTSLWSSQCPPQTALESLAPFCHDTLSFPLWMQWVMLPKMKQVIEEEVDIPTSSDIYPLAEYALTPMNCPTEKLLQLIKQFDQLISRGKTSHRPQHIQ